jgi:hypothetical protein
MKITVQFPLVMKLQFNAILDIKESEGLPEINSKIFEAFWRVMGELIPQGKHGAPEHIILKDNIGIEITNIATFKSSFEKSPIFNAVI